MNEQELSRRGVLKGAASLAAASGMAVAGSGQAFAGPAGGGKNRRAADMVVMNGRVLTMTDKKRAQAVAVKNGKIIAVGSNREIGRLANRKTQVVDAAGGTVLPGINDGHFHFNGFGMSAGQYGFEPPRPWQINVSRPTAAEIAQAVAAAAASAARPDAWIRGSGWNGNVLDRLPTRDVLDPVSGDHPVILNDFSHHATAVNSKALELAGITRDTVPPPGGVIEKDANGEPTGILREGASGLVSRIVPPYSEEERSEAFDFAVTVAHALGITSLTDPGVAPATVEMYAAKLREGKLPLRVNLMLGAGPSLASLTAALDGFRRPRDVNPRWLRVGEVKVMGDGVPTEAQTAWLHEPYVDGRNGQLNVTGDTIEEQVEMLESIIKLAAARGFQIGAHATGDATIDAVVAAYLSTKSKSLRHYVIHGDLTPEATLRTMARNRIGVSFNPTIKHLLGRTLDSVIGPERVDYQWPFRTALDNGVKASSASDAAVVTPDWLVGVEGAVTRAGMFGGIAGIEEAITVEEALTSYTRTPAWQDHAEKWKGRLKQNYVADITILDGDILRRPVEGISDMKVAGTIVGGKLVYDATGSTASRARAAAVDVKKFRHDVSVECLQAGACCCAINEKSLAEERARA